MTTSFDEAIEAYQLPRLIKLAPGLYGACFTLMKMIPARYILRRAAAEHKLEPDTVIVETTSGTFGLALAMQAVSMKRRLILVSDPVIDDRFYRRLTDLGVKVERVPADAGLGVGGYQAARLARLREIMASEQRTYCPEQYSNADNPKSYARVAELFLECLGQVDCVIGPVGSGGSMCGTVGHLRTEFPDCQAVGVDTHSSVLFGHRDGPRELRGLGMSVMPANLNHEIFDSVHWCTAALAYKATRQLHQRHALFMGPTSGAAYLVARWWAARNPDARAVVMLPDEGYRYQDTVYSDKWLSNAGYEDVPIPVNPVDVSYPGQSGGDWICYSWKRQSYADAMKGISVCHGQ